MLDERALMLQGGATGPAIVPGHPEKSLLIRAIQHTDEQLKMPRKGKLSGDEITLLIAWVKAGAPWTDEKIKSALRPPGKITSEDRKYWAFQALQNVDPPAGTEKNPVDRFILARLQHEGLHFSKTADPRALIRRITFDLIGLPPTSDEIDAFVSEYQAHHDSTRAQVVLPVIEKLVDRLLASPHYGERWARHWLDVVRFAESDGYRLDSFRPHAYRYRDYVIKSFNDDKPYDQFVREQIAGDEIHPDQTDGLVAIGFLTHGIYEFNQRDVRGQWHAVLSDITDVTSETFLGLSAGCARCHDHKFDPILQKDYYALRAFFEGMMPAEDLPRATSAQRREHAEQQTTWERKTTAIRRQIEAIEGPERTKQALTAITKFPPDIQAMLNKPQSQRTPVEQQLAALAHRQLVFEYEKLDTRIKGEQKEKLLQLRKELAGFDTDKPAAMPLCQSFHEVGIIPPETMIPKKTSDPAIKPAFLTVLNQAFPSIEPPAHQQTSGRRAALARWLTQPDHPLTSRVMVNRIWQQHFGQGLVATANDFGNLGEKPSHPELLDWLARRFVQDGWSMKKMHRLIVTSRTYQQSAMVGLNAKSVHSDPENRLLGRMTSHRLDAEQIRDAMLAVTGKLDRRIGGPSVELKEPRRSIYLKVLRNTREPLLEVFDSPEGFVSTARRNVTTTSPQALLMLNSPMMLQQGQALANLLFQEKTTSDVERIEQAFQRAFGRAPSSKEREFAQNFLTEQQHRITPTRDKIPVYEVAKIPFHDGKAAVITPRSTQARFQLPEDARLPATLFTLEAYVYLSSVFEDGTVRTIASHWNGEPKSPGWVFGVTGKKSAYKPQSLVLQLWGDNQENQHTAEAIFSGLSMQLNRPYYLAVAVNVQDTSDRGITFYLKDLANDEEPVLSYSTTHRVVRMSTQRGNFTIGGTVGKVERTWDGMIDDVRLSSTRLALHQLLPNDKGIQGHTVAYWQFESSPGMLEDSSPNRLTLQRYRSASMPPTVTMIDPRRAAWVDFCQVLLNANEFLYVD